MSIHQTDIAVIGGGIAGCSAAAALSEYCSVLLLEREPLPAMHATGRSAAYYAPAYGNDTVRALTAAGSGFFSSPPNGFTEVPLLHTRGALFVATRNQSGTLAALESETPWARRLDGPSVHDQVPILRSGPVTTGLLDDTGGDLDVDALVQGFLRHLRANGGTFETGSNVTSMHHGNSGWVLRTNQATHHAPVVLNAAGAWADAVAGLAGLEPLGLEPRRRTALTVDPPPGLDIQRWPMVIDADEQFYFKPDAGRLLLSPADETPSPPCDAQPEALDIAIAIDRIQQVADLPVTQVRSRWAGLRTFAHDRTFVVGFDPRTLGFYWLAGQGGYGVQSCAGVADLVTHALQAGDSVFSTLDAAAAARLLTATNPDRLLGPDGHPIYGS